MGRGERPIIRKVGEVMSSKKSRQLRAFVEQKDGSFIINPTIRQTEQSREVEVKVWQDTKPQTREIEVTMCKKGGDLE